MNLRPAMLLALFGALGMMLSCSGTTPVVLPKSEAPAPVFSEIGSHVLPETRRVELDVRVVLNDISDKAKRVQIWVPTPGASTAQTIMEPIIESPVAYRPILRLDQVYNSPSIFLIIDEPLQQEYTDKMHPLPKEVRLGYTMQVERRRVSAVPSKPGQEYSPMVMVAPEEFRKQFAADLKPLSEADDPKKLLDVAKLLAAVPAATDNTILAPARAIYNYVVDTFAPADASASSIKETFETRRGTALDYALATTALMRAAGIPAHVESGFYLPENRSADPVELKERAAWVVFYVSGAGWTACDPYLADRSPELKDYLFGGLDANRVQMSVGPAPGLMPPPESGAPLVLKDVLAEADGKPMPAAMTVRFRDVCAK